MHLKPSFVALCLASISSSQPYHGSGSDSTHNAASAVTTTVTLSGPSGGGTLSPPSNSLRTIDTTGNGGRFTTTITVAVGPTTTKPVSTHLATSPAPPPPRATALPFPPINACVQARARSIPFLRAFNQAWSDHFYTSGVQDMKNAVALGYVPEASPGRIFNTQVPGSVPFFRAVNDQWHDHFYTSSRPDLAVALGQLGYHQEDNAGFLYPAPQCGAIPFFRLVNDQVHDHFYTSSAAERDGAAAAGYHYEGIAGYLLPN